MIAQVKMEKSYIYCNYANVRDVSYCAGIPRSSIATSPSLITETPSESPTRIPTETPSHEPTVRPTETPTHAPIQPPTEGPNHATATPDTSRLSSQHPAETPVATPSEGGMNSDTLPTTVPISFSPRLGDKHLWCFTCFVVVTLFI